MIEPASTPDEPVPSAETDSDSHDASVVTDVIAVPEPLPQPNFGFAILWSFLLLGAQLIIGLVGGAFLAVLAVSQVVSPQEFLDPASEATAAINTLLIPVATLSTTVTAIVVVVFLFRGKARRVIAWRGCSPTQWLLTILAVIPMSIVASELANWAAEVLPSFGSEMIDQLRGQSWLLVFFAACVLPGLGEEIFFRGFLSRGLCARHGVVAGTLMASLLFGLVHVEPVQSCGAAVMGIALQWVFLSTRSLWAPIVLHTVNNTLAFAALKYGERYFPIPGYSYMPNDQLTHSPVVLFLAGLASAAAICWAFYTSRTHWVLPSGKRWSAGYVTAQMPAKHLDARPVSGFPSVLSLIAVIATSGFLAWAIWFSIEK